MYLSLYTQILHYINCSMSTQDQEFMQAYEWKGDSNADAWFSISPASTSAVIKHENHRRNNEQSASSHFS